MRWTNGQIKTLTRLRSEGRLASEIAMTMGLTVSQVNNKLYWLGLTKDRQRNALKIRAEREGDVVRQRPSTTHLERQVGYALGYVLGVLLGDGSIWKDKRGGNVMRLRVRDAAFASKFKRCLAEVCLPGTRISTSIRKFNQPESMIRTPEHSYRMRAKRVRFYEVTCSDPSVVRFFTRLVKSFLSSRHNADIRRGALEGLFDSEGFIVKSVGHVGLQMTNHGVIRWISREISSNGIEHKVYISPTGYLSKISIHRKSAIKRFCSLIRFSVPRREALRMKFSRNCA
jgi:hypothetical protein